MVFLYSFSAKGFYRHDIHGDDIPADAVEITAAEHAALLSGQGEGQRIVSGPDGRPMLTEPPAPTPEQLAAAIRTKRDGLLSACDWTQVADAPVDKAAWATYRQALRDITFQVSFPTDVTWPVAP